MGNFSRNTFVQSKNYVAVRLEQGVPLVDADWNELQDVTRFETYEALRAAAPNVAARGGLDVSVAGPNDISVSAGRAVADGRPLLLSAPLQYSTQRYANAATALADGVPQATPLTQPVANRTDCVYLDGFEREVTSGEDANLINGAIGLETSTRLKREIAVRVAQGASGPPAPAAGHVHFPIAFIDRTAAPIAASQIRDAKPYPLPLGPREVAFAPALLPVNASGVAQPAFTIDAGLFPYRLLARKPSAQLTAFGVMQLPRLPDGARMIQIRVRGISPGTMSWQFVRGRLDGGLSTLIINPHDFLVVAGAFDRLISIPATEPPVNNSTYYYQLAVYESGTPQVGDFYGGSIRYAP